MTLETDTVKSLHSLKDTFTKSRMGAQCDELLAYLDESIAVTKAKAPFRKQGYMQPRGDHREVDATSTEALIETAMWRQRDRPCALWDRIISYQVPLRSTRKAGQDEGWGGIDLLAVSVQRLPVVIELKRGTAQDTPAKMLVQAAAYALALRSAWPLGFRDEWNQALERVGLEPAPADLARIELVCAAPGTFWERWRGDTGPARAVTEQDWASLKRLVTAFDEAHHLPVRFAEVHGLDSAQDQREVVIAEIDLFTGRA